MADKVEYSRLLIKRSNQSGVVPTIPGPGQGLTQFTPTDTFIGEFFLNQQDDNLWIRTQNGQIPILSSGSTFPGGSGNCITDLYITNLYGCSPITLHDDFEVITNKLFRNQSGGIYDNTLSFGNSLFSDLIRLRAEDTSTSNESDLRLRTNDALGNAIMQGGVVGTNATNTFSLSSDPQPTNFMSKTDLGNGWQSNYEVAGYSQNISTTDGNELASFFINDMTISGSINLRFDDFGALGSPFTLQTQNAQQYDIFVEDTTERMNVEITSKTYRVEYTQLPTTLQTRLGVEDTFIELETFSPNFPVIINQNRIYETQQSVFDVGPFNVLTLNGGLELGLGVNKIHYTFLAVDTATNTRYMIYDEYYYVVWDGVSMTTITNTSIIGFNNFATATLNFNIATTTIDWVFNGEPLTNVNYRLYVEVLGTA